MSIASALLPEISSANTQRLPKAYVIAEIEVVDASTYEGYKSAAASIAAQYGGRYIVRGGKIHLAEGDAPRQGGGARVHKFDSSPSVFEFR